MAGVFERMRWPQKRSIIVNSSLAPRVNLRVLELQVAKEILAEVFRVRISDVEDMIQNRYSEICYEKLGHEETELWPQEFMLNE
jgi:hypothetical protein